MGEVRADREAGAGPTAAVAAGPLSRVDAQATLPPRVRGLGPARQAAALVVLVVGLPLLTGLLVAQRERLAYATPVLLVLLLVVVVALTGGLRVALPAVLLGGAALNWFFTPPFHTLVVDRPEQLVVLGVYLAVAIAVSAVVDLAARRTAEAGRARAEAQALAAMAGATLAEQQTLPDLLERVRQVFGMREVVLLERTGEGWRTAAASATPDPQEEVAHAESELRVEAAADLQLLVRGPALFAEDRTVLRRFAEAAATALEGRRLAEQAEVADRLAATDRMRTALLAAVGHDLRTPLAGIKAAVSSLRQTDVAWSPQEHDELLETIETSADRLQALVENLLDASRLQAGAVSVRAQPVGLDEAVARVVLALPDQDRQRVHLDVPEGLPDALADPGLLERVLANLLDNALRYTPAGTMVVVHGRARPGRLRCEVVDHGDGVATQDRERLFAPFQRLADRAPGGAGLGLAVARGFAEAMGGTLVPRTTPGGGLTMQLTLPAAPAETAAPDVQEPR